MMIGAAVAGECRVVPSARSFKQIRTAQYEHSDDVGHINTGYGTLHELFVGRHLAQSGQQNT